MNWKQIAKTTLLVAMCATSVSEDVDVDVGVEHLILTKISMVDVMTRTSVYVCAAEKASRCWPMGRNDRKSIRKHPDECQRLFGGSVEVYLLPSTSFIREPEIPIHVPRAQKQCSSYSCCFPYALPKNTSLFKKVYVHISTTLPSPSTSKFYLLNTEMQPH